MQLHREARDTHSALGLALAHTEKFKQVALMDLSDEVPGPRRWNSFLAGLTINAVGVLLLITVGPRLTNSVPIEPIASNHYVPIYLPPVAPITAPVAHHLPPRSVPAPSQLAKLTPPPVAHIKTPE